MYQLKAFVIAFVGIAVCAGIISAFLTFVVLGLTSGPPLPPNDLVAGVVVSVLAGAVMVISLLATRRVLAEGGSGAFAFLARTVPVLALLGGGAGVAFAVSVQGDRRASEERTAQDLCERPSFWKLDAVACLEAARSCVKQTAASPADVEAFSRELTALLGQASARDRAHQEDPDPALTQYVERLSGQFYGAIAREKTQAALVCMAGRR